MICNTMHACGNRKTIIGIFAIASNQSNRRFCSVSATRPLAVVTGSSRGIGRSIALALGSAGCRVVVHYAHNKDMALEVADMINNQVQVGGMRASGEAVVMQADCSDPDSVNDMFTNIRSQLGPVDVLVNNAGITRDKLTRSMSSRDFTDVIDLNLNGVFYCSKAVFSSSMMRNKKGRIINIASVVGQIGNVGQANYAAAKGGVLGLTKSLAKEFSTRQVCVNAVCPGFIDSDMTNDLKNDSQLMSSIPLKRFGTPEEVASLVKFLALDPAGAYMTGHTFNIDGGVAIGAT